MYLQKYVDEKKLISFIENGLYFRKISKFEDKTEGNYQNFGARQVKLESSLRLNNDFINGGELRKMMDALMESEKEYLFLQSWHGSNYMSGRMWAEYSKVNEGNFSGAIIVFDSIAFTSSLLRTIPFGQRSQEVMYVDDMNLAQDPVFCKEKERFGWEKEWRLFFDLRELIGVNKKILKNMSGLNGLRETNVSVGAVRASSCLDEIEELFVYCDEHGFYFKQPDLSDLTLSILIPEQSSQEFLDKITGCLERNEWPKKIRKVNISCGLSLSEILNSGTCMR